MPFPHYIALVRDSRAEPAWPTQTAGAETSLLFLHGDGVMHAASESAIGSRGDVEIVVCDTSWRRRMGSAAPAGHARRGTLVEFFDRLDRAACVHCVGLGGTSATRHSPGMRLCIEIGFAPADDCQQREALEFALAAAALELDAEVRFTGAGCEHLTATGARGWQQFLDHDLLPLSADISEWRGQHDRLPAGVKIGRFDTVADPGSTVPPADRTILRL